MYSTLVGGSDNPQVAGPVTGWPPRGAARGAHGGGVEIVGGGAAGEAIAHDGSSARAAGVQGSGAGDVRACHRIAYLGMDDETGITPEFRARLLAAAERPLRVRREILLLAGHACGHLPGGGRMCRVCHKAWPCEAVHDAARSALEAVADLRA